MKIFKDFIMNTLYIFVDYIIYGFIYGSFIYGVNYIMTLIEEPNELIWYVYYIEGLIIYIIVDFIILKYNDTQRFRKTFEKRN